MTVTVYSSAGSYLASTTTGADGGYALAALETGSYKVEFTDFAQNLVKQYYHGKASIGQANAVAVTAGDATPEVDAALQPGGSLAGTITDARGGSPIAYGSVTVYSASGEFVTSTTSGADGSYTVRGLGEGTYKVQFSASGFEPRYSGDKGTLAEAEAVPVTVGEVAEGTDAALEPLGSIGGTVTVAQGGAALDEIEVCAYPVDGTGYETCARTGSNGGYTLSVPHPGEYRVAFYPGSEYLMQYYDDKPLWESADEVEVGRGEAVANIDAALQAAAHIRGTVTAAGSALPLQGIEVCAVAASGGAYAGCATTGSHGAYDIGGLRADEYDVEFISPESGASSGYLKQYYDGKAAAAEAEPVTVASGGAADGIDAALSEGGVIQGKVTNLGGTDPLADAGACAHEPESGAYRCGYTDDEGKYTIAGLPSGDYVVYFYSTDGSSPLQYYNGVATEEDATPVAVTAGGSPATGIDGRLEASGGIAGTVTSAATGKPLAGIEVCATTYGEYFGNCATSAGNGAYTLAGLSPGKHKVRFRSLPQTYETQYYEGKSTSEEAVLVDVGEAATTSGVDAAMIAAGQITGHVTSGADGHALEGIDVCAFPVDTSSYGHCALSGSDGKYELVGVPAGSYKVEFTAPPGVNYIGEYFHDKLGYEEAETVSAAAGTVTTGIDAAMQVGGEVEGKVTSVGSGTPIAGIEVCPYASGNGYSYGNCARTDAAGEYTIEKLTGGEYRVGFADPFNSSLNYVRQFYDGHARLSDANPFAVTAGTPTTGIDASLEEGGEVSGKVIRIGTKAPLQGVQVCPYEHGGYERAGACAQTDADGEYTLRGLPSGLVDVEFGNYEYFTRYYKEASSLSSATGVPVEALQDTTGIDAALKSTHPIVPEIVSPPTIDGSPHQGEAIGEEHGSWTNEPIEYAYQWLRCDEFGGDCAQIPGAEGQEYTPVAADVGGTLEIEETATNVEGTSLPAVSQPSSPVVPEKPENLDPPTIAGLARAGEALEAEPGYWTNEPTSYEYQWERCDENGDNCTLIAGAIERTYDLGSADIGSTVRVIETAANAGGEGEPAISAPSAAVVPEPPTDLSPPSINGAAVQGEVLSEEHGTWNGEPHAYGYQWERCSADGTGCTRIPGATDSTYVLVAADVGHRLVVAETASNAGGVSEPSVSAPSATVVAAAPVNEAPPTISGLLRPGATLEESHGAWTNEPSSYTYRWVRCAATGKDCEVLEGATEQTYVLVGADVGHKLVVEEVASNAGGTGHGVISAATAVVVAAVPSATRPPTLSGVSVQGETLVEHHGTWTEGPTEYKIEWERCDAAGQDCTVVAGGYDDGEYELTSADLGHTIRAGEAAANAGGYGDPARSAPSERTVAAAPLGTGQPTISGTLVEGETLTEAHGSWTNEPSSYSYQWERCSATGDGCEPIDGATGQTHVLAAVDVGHELVVVETAANAAGPGGPQASSPTAVVRPPVPVNTGAPSISGTARVGSTLTEQHGSWTNGPSSYSYQWELCAAAGSPCRPIAGATQQTYTLGADDLGMTLRVVEIATNVTGPGDPVASPTTAGVAPEPPVDVKAPTIVGSPRNGETLIVGQGTWSHDPTLYREQWLRCDADGENCASIHDAISPTYLLVAADVGHALRVRETAVNAGGAGDPAVSEPTAAVAAVPLRAVAGEGLKATAGVPVTLDGSGSSPAGEITAAHWDFGDGSGGDGTILRHTYAAAGHYTATLTVKRGTETSEASVDVTVAAAVPQPVTIMVTDKSGRRIAGAEVLYIGSDGTRIEARADGTGKAHLSGLPDGDDTVYALADGYRPAKEQVRVAGGTGAASIALTEGAVAVATLKSHEMTLAEIEAAGIDTSDPANQNVFEFEVGLSFGGGSSPGGSGGDLFGCYINSEGEFVGNCGGGGYSCYATACYWGGGGNSYVAVPRVVDGHPLIQWLILRGRVTVLKQFFTVNMVIQNLSESEPFEIKGGSATLALPPGMSLAPTANPQSLTQSVADVPPGGSSGVEWIARGDEPGEYGLSADYSGRLEPFGAPIQLHAALAEPLRVWGAEGLSLNVQADSGALSPGVPYHVRVGITNRADIPFYNVGVAIDPETHAGFIFQPGQRFEAQVGELGPGETVYVPPSIVVPAAASVGEFAAPLSFARFVGEEVRPGAGVEAVQPPPLYSLSGPTDTPNMVHLHWQAVPGAEGYEVFPTGDLSTPFAAEPETVAASPESEAGVQELPASATDAYLFAEAGAAPRYYAVSAIVGGIPTLALPVIKASPGAEPTPPGGSGGGGDGAGGGGGDGGGGSSGSGFDNGLGKPVPTCFEHTVKLSGGITVEASCFHGKGSTLTASGHVRVNGVDIVARGGIVLHKNTLELDANGAVDVYAGSLRIYHGSLAWRLSARLSLAVPSGLRIKGVPVSGAIGVSLVPGGAHATASALIDAPGFDVSGDINLQLTLENGLSLNSFKLALASNLPLKSLVVKKATLAYRHTSAGDVWEGGGEVALPAKGPTLAASVTVTNGSLTEVSVDAGHINKPIGEIVFLQSLGLKVTLHPRLAATGSIGLTAGPQILGQSAARLDGSLGAQLGSPFVLEAKGTLSVVDQKVESAWLKATIPGGVAFGGAVSRSFLIVNIEGTVAGAISAHALEAEGSAKVSVPGASGKGDVLVNNVGVAGCASAKVLWKTLTIGGAHRWSGDNQAFADSCGFDRLRSALGSGGRVAASASSLATDAPPVSIVVPGHTRQLNLVAHGVVGPPELVLRHGAAKVLVKPGSTGSLGHAVYLAVADPASGDTDVAIASPPAGPLSVAAPSGQPALATVRSALPLPDPQVRAKVKPLGGRRFQLSWSARRIRGQRLIFQDTDARGRSEVLSSARPRGATTFTAADDGAKGRHRLRIVVLQDGLIREARNGPRYTPAPVRIAKPRVTVKARRGKARISWAPLPQVAAYEVFVTASDGRRLFFEEDAKRHALQVPAAAGLTVAVRGIGAGLERGPKGTVRLERHPRRAHHGRA